MAEGVKVNISSRSVVSALNTPGGGVFEWRDKVGREITEEAISISPVNDVMNALHRDGVVGVYKASWSWDRIGSNQHRVRARIENSAAHATYVEDGRRGSTKVQTFSWTEWHGAIHTVGGEFGGGTRGRRGQHVLRNATNRIMAGVAAPLA